ncbi:MAG: insulinase family protein [Bacteroidales bacterium]|nr:insulinase family protein [Bacteroidales bacterium]
MQFDKTIDRHNHEVNAVIGAVAPSLYQEKERIAAVLLANILGGPASNSILNSLLREKNGWVYSVECSYTQYTDSGIMAISIGCDKANLDKCINAINKAITKLQEQPLSPARLRAAKKQLIGQMAISSDNGETQCLAMGKSLLAFGRISSFEEDRARIEAVTAEELQQAARSIFAPGKISKLVYL